ncbi:MAG: hypothetical protein JNK05_36675 [Myxococcales bacterium]|nr:hypothetical protein [Myxococcales bacterium]
MNSSALLRLSLSIVLAGCGARSELIAPRADVFVAAIDAARDARTTAPCTRDGECDDGIACTEDRCNVRAGRCAHTARDRLCDDGLFCTGVERCDVATGCARQPVQCGDAVECTEDRCDETLRQCVRTPNDARCPVSYRCDETEGCLARAFAHGARGLYEVLLPSVRVRLIAPVSASLTDIALHPDRTLYAIGSTGLYRLDASNGAAEFLVPFEHPFASLDATADGTLYAAAGRTLYRIDLERRAAIPTGEFPPGLESSGDLAVLEGRLVATARADATTSNDTLVELATTSSGTARVIGPIGSGCVWGLAAFGPTLYGFSCEGQVLRIDPNTGRGAVLALSDWRFFGATAR